MLLWLQMYDDDKQCVVMATEDVEDHQVVVVATWVC